MAVTKRPGPTCVTRGEQRGAAIFVVVLALALLTGVGFWSLRTTSMVDQASGFARAASQGQYLAEMGLITTSAMLSLPVQATLADNIAMGKSNVGTPDFCSGTAPNAYCRVFELSDVDSFTKDNLIAGSPGTGQPVFDTLAGGSFNAVRSGAVGSLMAGEFRVEMTDPQLVTVAGEAIGTTRYKRVAMTSMGLVRPNNATGVFTESENRSAVQLGVRAHLLIGPLY